MLMLILTLAGCGKSNRDAMILISGDTRGWITPCGCASNQSGGLPRRAGLIHARSTEHDLLVLDAGGSAIGTGEYQLIKFTSLLTGLKALGLDAHNIGGAETEFTPSQLRELAKQTGVTWLTSNLVAADGQPVGSRCLIVQRGGLEIAVTGVVDEKLVQNHQWKTQDPVRSALNAFAEHPQADVKVLLAYFDEAGLRTLAESLPEVDYLVGGPTGQAMSATRVGPVTILAATNKGKFMAEIKLVREKLGFRELQSGIVEVKSELTEAKPQLENLQDYYNKLRQRDFTAKEAGLVQHLDSQDAGYAISGSASCQACHQSDDAIWHSSKHSHAWEVLVKKSAQFDPNCQQCHTTGYGHTGGFENVAQSPMLVHVGCENCHGPSLAHVKDPRKRTPFPAKEQCVRCHDHENSPTFDFTTYWAKVFHAANDKAR